MEPFYNEWWDNYCEENYEACYPIYYDDWEDDWAYQMEPYYEYDSGYNYDSTMDKGYPQGYYYGETYYYMDGPAEEQGIMNQIGSWFSGDSSNKLFGAAATLAAFAAI